MGGLPMGSTTSTLALPGSQQNHDTPISKPETDTKQGSQQNHDTPISAPGRDTKPKKKICCACPETKKLRDECIVEHGEDACAKWIEAHRKCLRAEGFNV
ncbi:cytochrome c oxidase copper chaperone 1 [Ziziphus jujuba]|uniref:Cytochrome c oxidase copper chaperone 1 n=2 Tax=Ziziphus jujuba TaxID=326968 RepID=A0A6P3ZYS1_ZIZJJ|nr:cytochrome c oxidase copper chaperone 1 [Ziziphus jujuba]